MWRGSGGEGGEDPFMGVEMEGRPASKAEIETRLDDDADAESAIYYFVLMLSSYT